MNTEGASGPACYRRALSLVREAADLREQAANLDDDQWGAGGKTLTLRTSDQLTAEAAVYAQLAHAAAIIDTADDDQWAMLGGWTEAVAP